MDISSVIASELGISRRQVDSVRALLDEGCTIPFIARYRKEATGGLDDVTLRDLDERLAYLEGLEARKAEVLRAIDEQGKLTADLRVKVEEAGADIDVALEKRFDLLSEEIEAVKKYLSHEYQIMTDLTAARVGADLEEKRMAQQQEISEEVLKSIDQEIAR